VVKSLKETGQYENTIIVLTTDNGGAQKVGGNNMPLRGTKGGMQFPCPAQHLCHEPDFYSPGTLYEGGTRAIGFIHSPLLEKTGYTSPNLMHAVDWLPTLMAAIGRPGFAVSATDGEPASEGTIHRPQVWTSGRRSPQATRWGWTSSRGPNSCTTSRRSPSWRPSGVTLVVAPTPLQGRPAQAHLGQPDD
jgi:arylsulfatase A-like enzyme